MASKAWRHRAVVRICSDRGEPPGFRRSVPVAGMGDLQDSANRASGHIAGRLQPTKKAARTGSRVTVLPSSSRKNLLRAPAGAILLKYQEFYVND